MHETDLFQHEQSWMNYLYPISPFLTTNPLIVICKHPPATSQNNYRLFFALFLCRTISHSHTHEHTHSLCNDDKEKKTTTKTSPHNTIALRAQRTSQPTNQFNSLCMTDNQTRIEQRKCWCCNGCSPGVVWNINGLKMWFGHSDWSIGTECKRRHK